MVKDLYERKGAILGIEQLMVFVDDSIAIDISEEGTTVKAGRSHH